jgi:hypothetical protein
MSHQEHWSKRLHDALSAQEKPSYELLEEAVQCLLQERQGLTATLTDMAKQVGRIVIARQAGSTDGVLSLIDTLIEKHVGERKPATAVTH